MRSAMGLETAHQGTAPGPRPPSRQCVRRVSDRVRHDPILFTALRAKTYFTALRAKIYFTALRAKIYFTALRAKTYFTALRA